MPQLRRKGRSMVSVNRTEKKQSEAAKVPLGRTGIPKAVQARFEAASGLSFEDVRVHYNSSMPARLGAYAYTQGSQVYIGPGQERHLEHELGHVVQQKRGLVRADGYINGIPVNRDPRLEQAADAGAGQPAQGVFKSGGGTVQMMLGGQGGGGPAPVLGPAPPVPEQEPAAVAEAAPAPEEGPQGIAALPADGCIKTCDEVLALALRYLGPKYAEPEPERSKGRYVSEDGTRVVRMGDNDIYGIHGVDRKRNPPVGPHVNFEVLIPNPDKPGKMMIDRDIHVYLEGVPLNDVKTAEAEAARAATRAKMRLP